MNKFIAGMILVAVTSGFATTSYHLFKNGYIFFGFVVAVFALPQLKVLLRPEV